MVEEVEMPKRTKRSFFYVGNDLNVICYDEIHEDKRGDVK